MLAPLYPIHNSAPSSSSWLTLNYKQLRFGASFFPQYLAVKDSDLEHALLFSLLKLSIAVLPPEKQSFFFNRILATLSHVIRLCLGSSSWAGATRGQEATGAHSGRKNPPHSKGSSPRPHKKPKARPDGRAGPPKRCFLPRCKPFPELTLPCTFKLGAVQ